MLRLDRIACVGLMGCALIACGDDSTTPADGGAGGSGGAGASGAEGGGGEGASSTQSACVASFELSSLEGASWDDRFTISGFTGHDGVAPAAHDFAIDVDGSVVAAGRFQGFEGQAVPPLMRFREGGWEPARETWEIEAPLDGFSAIAISDTGELALATNDSFGERDGEIWIDDGAGLQSIGSFQGQVRSLAFYGERLWVAGLFILDGEVPAEGLAVWDGEAWGIAPGGALDGSAFELMVADGTLYVGGAFTAVGGVNAANVASYDGEAWTGLDFPEAMVIYALARTESGELYAGGAYGRFMSLGGLARWSGAVWETVGGGLAMYQTRGVVTDIAVHGETVDVTGCFSSAGGFIDSPDAEPASSFARWGGSEWEDVDNGAPKALTPWFQPGACGDESESAIWDVTHQRLAFADDKLFAGGWFAGAGDVLSQAIVVYQDDEWQAQGQTGLGIGGSVDFIGVGGEGCDEIYGLGSFSHAAGEPTSGHVVRFEGDHWVALPDSLPPFGEADTYCPTLDVSADGRVAVGCTIIPPEGEIRGVILTREGDALVEMPLGGLPPIAQLKWVGDAIYLVGNGLSGYLARVDGTTITMLEEGFDNVVNQVQVNNENDIVVSGAFTTIDGEAFSRIAHWDGKAWSALGDGLPGQVLAMDRLGSTVYVSTYNEGNGAYLLGAFDGTEWRELAGGDSGLAVEDFYSFNQIVAKEDGVVLVGTAQTDGGRGAFVYRDGTFETLAGGVGAIGVSSVAFAKDALWIGGIIAQAGEPDPVSSIGVARLAP